MSDGDDNALIFGDDNILGFTGEVYFAGASVCPKCKRMVRHKPNGGPRRWHGCRVRWISRRVGRARAEGWNEGYGFALKHISDPMVYRDLNEYGAGWAGLIAQGGLTITAGHEEDGEQ